MAQIAEEYGKITVFKQKAIPDLLWSWSPIQAGRGGVVRVAALDSERVRSWFRDAFYPLRDVLGVDTYHKAFS